MKQIEVALFRAYKLGRQSMKDEIATKKRQDDELEMLKQDFEDMYEPLDMSFFMNSDINTRITDEAMESALKGYRVKKEKIDYFDTSDQSLENE